MDETNVPSPDEKSEEANDTSVAPYDLLFITRAYNRKEITFDEWLELTRKWAEQMIKHSKHPERRPP